jgi:predicted TIM-barrel fold metal-dependent hydrolase
MIDVNCFIGGYPFRELPHPDASVLVRVLEREGIARAWVGHLPTAFHRDVTAGNEALFAALASHRTMLDPVPAIRPDWPRWERALGDAQALGARAIRAYPSQWGMGPHDPALARLAGACGESGLPLVLTTRFEDARQRSAIDVAPDLSGAHIRTIVRADARVRVIVTSAGRALIEESHWGLTPEERVRLSWDISWIWGPPEDDLAHLLRTVGADHFLFGSGWPLRLMQSPIANLELLPSDVLRLHLAEVSEKGARNEIGVV